VFSFYFHYTTTVASDALTADIARHPSHDTMTEPVILLDIEAKRAKILPKDLFKCCFELIMRKVTLCQIQRTEC